MAADDSGVRLREPGTATSRGAAVGIGLVLALVCGLALIESHHLGRQIALAERASLDEDVFQQIRYGSAREQLHAMAHLETRSAAERDSFRAAARKVVARIDEATLMERGESDGTDDNAELVELRGMHTRYVTAAEEMIAAVAADRAAEAEAIALSRLVVTGDAMLDQLELMVDEHRVATTRALAAARSSGRMLQVGTPIALLLTLVLLGGLAFVVRLHQRTVRRQALHDGLTGLPNRLLFEDRAGQAMTAAARSGDQPVVMLLDLDRFKEVNDTLGHHAGDELLLQLAERLVAGLRPSDTVARLGGDEFALLLPTGGREVGTEIAGRIRAAMEPPFLLDGVSVAVEASIGIATADRATRGREDVEDLVEDLVRQADTAMYVAKSERCGFSHYAAGSADETATERLGLLAELREALDQDRMVLHYQPKLSASTGELTGVEALVRWEHPERGIIGPDKFVPLAEGTTLIHRLTHVVVQRALAFARERMDEGVRVPVAVNISARTLLDRGFPRRIANLLEEARVPAELLGIEITESTIMLDPDRALAILTELRDMGVRLSVDDFGTGYSSMSYLKHLPVQELKVDRSFVRDMAADEEDRTLVQSAIDLGHNLGLSVVAEGVETPEALAALRELGADDVQGYLFARPMPEEELRAWMEARQHAPTA